MLLLSATSAPPTLSSMFLLSPISPSSLLSSFTTYSVGGANPSSASTSTTNRPCSFHSFSLINLSCTSSSSSDGGGVSLVSMARKDGVPSSSVHLRRRRARFDISDVFFLGRRLVMRGVVLEVAPELVNVVLSLLLPSLSALDSNSGSMPSMLVRPMPSPPPVSSSPLGGVPMVVLPKNGVFSVFSTSSLRLFASGSSSPLSW
mmetsp:Transcript_10192/g.22046  ORF Transcript_10192/g.22046 Transcript_10192/m.22046 type:complete len:203 (-) Transcript_10192:877-1485(-)